MIPLLHTAISERFRGAARDEALYKSTFTLLTLLYFTNTTILTPSVIYTDLHQNRTHSLWFISFLQWFTTELILLTAFNVRSVGGRDRRDVACLQQVSSTIDFYYWCSLDSFRGHFWTYLWVFQARHVLNILFNAASQCTTVQYKTEE